MKEGWVCPRCGKVLAPFAYQCDCKPDRQVYNGECDHVWEVKIMPGGLNYYLKCHKCGKIK